MTEEEKGTETQRPWTPNKTRRVKSKKSFDQKKMDRLVNDEGPIYRGELDPRKKDPAKKPRSISRSEEMVMAKAEALAEAENASKGKPRVVITDFRDQFERCEASPGRLGALYATREVRIRSAYAQEVIEATIDRSKLTRQDRAFATLLTLGVVSCSGALDDVINRALASPRDIKPDVRDAMRISTYEIIYLRKAPHAALDQGVELVRAIAPSAAGLANAVLHRILGLADQFPFGDPNTDIEALSLACAFPTWLAKKLVRDMGAASAAQLMQASNEPAPAFICVNALKAKDDDVIALFQEVGTTLEPAAAAGVQIPGCYRVPDARALADGRIRHEFALGSILVSDAAAQAVAAAVLEDGMPESLLEIGAGRGTKTIMIQSAAMRKFGQQVKLSSLDAHAFKTKLLADRAEQYGVALEDIITGNATRLHSVLKDRTFTNIFIDAPCSGLGTLRRHQEIRWRVQSENIAELAETGLAMLKSAASHVAPGGQIVYSTCTVTYDENNGVVKSFLESEEGTGFALAPLYGKSAFVTELSSGTPDAHFAVKFIKKK